MTEEMNSILDISQERDRKQLVVSQVETDKVRRIDVMQVVRCW